MIMPAHYPYEIFPAVTGAAAPTSNPEPRAAVQLCSIRPSAVTRDPHPSRPLGPLAATSPAVCHHRCPSVTRFAATLHAVADEGVIDEMIPG